ncbi:hypothetical protein ADU59_00400 (plasmid) [Pararhizobium polonicum]|uniref:Uncharacterized protein n=1 Tax=Pararhizobium polonicum TaxID=1612624 RepID=A0A1C7P8F1_9HYPH|nr:hypothetical protein ADU59_00400 [Pararhizobium polonicum]
MTFDEKDIAIQDPIYFYRRHGHTSTCCQAHGCKFRLDHREGVIRGREFRDQLPRFSRLVVIDKGLGHAPPIELP